MKILLTFVGFRDPYVPGSMQLGPILSLLTLRDFDRAILLATPQTKNNLEQTICELRAKKPGLQIEQIETPLSRQLVSGEVTDHSRLMVEFKKGELVFKAKAARK